MDMMTDLYPSRVASKPSITERKDPVVHGGGSGPLTREQLEAYERDGFLAFEQFFTDEDVRALCAEARRLEHDSAGSDAETVILEPSGSAVRSIFAIHRDDPAFARLAQDPRLVGIAEQLLGSRVYIHQSRINYKPGFDGKEFYWHSDFETWHAEDGMPRMRALSMSIALSPNTPNNGPIMLIPGSHKYYVSCVGETPEDNYKSSLRRQETGVPDNDSLAWLAEQGGIAAPVGPAGSLVLFECNTMHGSNSNITPLPRNNVFLVFNSVENALVEPFGGLKPRPDYNGHMNFTPIMAA